MKYFLLFIFLLVGTLQLSAQVDGPRGGMAIPKKKKNAAPTKPSLSNEGTFSIKPEKKQSKPMYQIGAPEEQKSPMSTETRFVNRGSEYEDKFEIKEKRESSEPYKGNQFFGEFRSKSVYVQVMCRDFEYADGDRIKVLVNDKVVIPEIELINDYQVVNIPLEKGFNKIDFEALNQGTSGPNTAEFVVYDDKKETLTQNQWNLATGFKATVMLVKE
jgi:hypothetical protein